MKLFRRVCSIVIAAALILTIFAVAVYSGTSAETEYLLTASAETVAAGAQANVNITLAGSGVYGAQMVIGYNSDLLTVSGVSVAPAVTAAGLRAVVNPAYSPSAVSVMIYGAQEIPTGVIATLTFDTDSAIDTETVSNITFDSILLSDSSAAALTGTAAQNGSVTVNSGVTEPEHVLNTAAKNLTLTSDITLNVYVDPAYTESYGYSDLYIEFSLSDRHRTAYPESGRVNGYLCFKFNNINPYEMSQDITYTLYGTFDGRLYHAEPKTYSVVTYCANTFKKGTVSDVTKIMLADMLNYGAAVQVYKNMYTDAMCNTIPSVADYVDYYETTSTPELNDISDKAYETVESPAATWKGASLNLGTAVSMQFAFNTDESKDDIEVRVYDGSTLKQTLSGDDIVYESSNGGFYYVKFSKYGVAYMRHEAYAVVYKNGVKISNTYKYSIESYAQRMLGKSTDQNLKDVCTTMMKYGISAEAYVAS